MKNCYGAKDPKILSTSWRIPLAKEEKSETTVCVESQFGQLDGPEVSVRGVPGLSNDSWIIPGHNFYYWFEVCLGHSATSLETALWVAGAQPSLPVSMVQC
jgi:hypothetical protein